MSWPTWNPRTDRYKDKIRWRGSLYPCFLYHDANGRKYDKYDLKVLNYNLYK